MKLVVFDRIAECTEAEVQRLLPQVSPQRREQALRYRHTFGQFCCLKSWLMLAELVGEMPDWQYNEHGKPYIADGPYFSISHCKQAVAVAVADRPIGIDVENIRHAEAYLITRTMNAAEQKQIAEAEDQDRAFTSLWTRKEAVVKAQGVGIESFEQLQRIRNQESEFRIETIEKEKYIYSIAYKQ